MSRSTLKKHKHNNPNKPKKQLKHVNLKQNKHTIRARGLKTKPMAGGSLKRNKIKQLGGECSSTQFIIKIGTKPTKLIIYDTNLVDGVPTARYAVADGVIDCNTSSINSVKLQVYKTNDDADRDALNAMLNKNKTKSEGTDFVLRYKPNDDKHIFHYIGFMYGSTVIYFPLIKTDNNIHEIDRVEKNPFINNNKQINLNVVQLNPHVNNINETGESQPTYDNMEGKTHMSTGPSPPPSTNTRRPPPDAPPPRPPGRPSLRQPPPQPPQPSQQPSQPSQQPSPTYEEPVPVGQRPGSQKEGEYVIEDLPPQYVAPVLRQPEQLYAQPSETTDQPQDRVPVPLFPNPLYIKQKFNADNTLVYDTLAAVAIPKKEYKKNKKKEVWYDKSWFSDNSQNVLVLIYDSKGKSGEQLYFKVAGTGEKKAPRINIAINTTYKQLTDALKDYTNQYSFASKLCNSVLQQYEIFIKKLGEIYNSPKTVDETTITEMCTTEQQTQGQPKAGGGSAHVDHSSVYGTVGSKNPNTTTKSRRQHKLVTTRRRTIKKHN